MNGIFFLNHTDFEVTKGERGDMMSLKYDKNGMTLVLFYSKELPTCEFLMTRFKQLPALMNGCNFAMVNMNKNMDLVEMSRNTIAPIAYVPDLTLFVNGCPFIRYDGPQEIENICQFLKDIYDKIHKLKFSQGTPSVPIPVTPTTSPAGLRPQDVEFKNQVPMHIQKDPNAILMNTTSDLFTNKSNSGVTNYAGHKNQFYNERVQPAIPPGLQNPNTAEDTLKSTSVLPIPAYTVGVPKSNTDKRNYMSFTNAYNGEGSGGGSLSV